MLLSGQSDHLAGSVLPPRVLQSSGTKPWLVRRLSGRLVAGAAPDRFRHGLAAYFLRHHGPLSDSASAENAVTRLVMGSPPRA